MELTHQLQDTQAAFDSVAADYDGPRGNNALIQRMRDEVWRTLARNFPAGARLLDLGCGTGLDAVYLGQQGYRVLATDWSPLMVGRAKDRVRAANLEQHVQTLQLGMQEIGQLATSDRSNIGSFDGIYSNFGAINCAPDLPNLASQCAQLLKPNGKLVFAVIGRICPIELAHYVAKRNWKRAKVRFAPGMVSVNLNKHKVWTRYYTPREFSQPFAPYFEIAHCRALSLFVPPPYLTGLYDRARPVFDAAWWLDDHVGHWPVLRNMGDHFLITLRKRSGAL